MCYMILHDFLFFFFCIFFVGLVLLFFYPLQVMVDMCHVETYEPGALKIGFNNIFFFSSFHLLLVLYL